MESFLGLDGVIIHGGYMECIITVQEEICFINCIISFSNLTSHGACMASGDILWLPRRGWMRWVVWVAFGLLDRADLKNCSIF